MKTRDGKFQTFTSIEVKRENLLNEMLNKISKDQKMKEVYVKIKYEKIFNEELKKVYEN